MEGVFNGILFCIMCIIGNILDKKNFLILHELPVIEEIIVSLGKHILIFLIKNTPKMQK